MDIETDARRDRRSRIIRRVALGLVAAICMGAPGVAPASPVAAAAPQTTVTGIAYGPLSRQRLDLLYPPEGTPVRGTVVWAHGGGWVGGTRTLTDADLVPHWLADQGWVIASVEYDLSTALPGAVHSSFPSAVADMHRAVRWVRRNQLTYGLGSKVVLGGGSAGAHLSLLAGLMHPRRTGLRGRDIVVDGIMGFVPPTNLLRMYADNRLTWGTVLGAFAGCPIASTERGPSPCDGALGLAYRLAVTSVEPWLRLAKRDGLDIPPIFLVGGIEDRLVPLDTQVRPLARRWRLVTGKRTSAVVRACACGHNIDPALFDTVRLRAWLDAR